MKELIFPIVALLFLFFLVIPGATLLSKGFLSFLRRRASSAAFGSAVPYLLVVVPTLAPVAWFLSSALHEAESDSSLAACVWDHGSVDCHDSLLFAGVLGVALALSALRNLTSWRRAQSVAVTESRALSRIALICAAHPVLSRNRHIVRVVTGADQVLCTRGLFRPRIEIDVRLLRLLGDDALEAALLHEVEHVRGLDPLRYAMAAAALALNPLARLLRPELEAWRFGREAACDRASVGGGANALALALALVKAAGDHARPGPVAALNASGIERVRARIALLLEYADRLPVHHRPRWSNQAIVTVLVGLILAFPHAWGATHFDQLHRGIEESAARALGR